MATLQELKAANEAEEAAAAGENVETETTDTASPQAVENEEEVETVEDELEETTEDAESEEKEASETDTEDWKQGDSHESQAEKKFTDGDIGKVKSKLKAKLDRQHVGEVEQLQKRIEELEKGNVKPVVQTSDLSRPKREDFYESDDQDEAYLDALTDYKVNKFRAEQSAEQATNNTVQQQQAQLQSIETAVDQHYVRATELAEKSGISPEMYQGADLRVRQMVESIFPNGGDLITDGFIANLGEGSEKVFYNIGVNSQRASEFQERLRADGTGLKAAMYLGQLNSELSTPSKRKTTAPKPAPHVKGDKQGGESHRALRKKYDAAHKSKDPQAAFNARREARKAGADTSNW